jgi:hypothetical protein
VTRALLVSVARVVSAALAASPFMASVVRAGTVSSGVGVSGAAEYSTNPFLLDTTNGGVVRGYVSVSPSIEEKSARSSLRVSANAIFSKYSRKYRDSVDLSSQVGYNAVLDRGLSVRAGVSISSTIGAGYENSAVFVTPNPDDVVPRPIDFTLVGTTQRTTSARGSAGVNYAVDAKNSLSLGYDVAVLRFPTAGGRNEYSNLSQSASYSRVINPRLSLGASVSVARVDYFGTALGDARIISPSTNASLRVARQWTISGGVGFSSTRVNVVGGAFTSTDLSGSLSACRADQRTNFCLNGGRSTGASSIDGVRTTSSLGVSYSYKITSRDTLSASGGYSRSGTPRLSIVGPTTYISASTRYERRFASNISGYVAGGFTRSTLEQTRSNASISMGINYNFGSRR